MTTSEQSGRHRPNTAGASPTPLSESPLPENPDDYYDFTIKRLSMHVSAVPDEDVQQSEHITKKAPNGFNLTDIIKQNMHVHNLGRVTSLTNGDVQVVDVELVSEGGSGPVYCHCVVGFPSPWSGKADLGLPQIKDSKGVGMHQMILLYDPMRMYDSYDPTLCFRPVSLWSRGEIDSTSSVA